MSLVGQASADIISVHLRPVITLRCSSYDRYVQPMVIPSGVDVREAGIVKPFKILNEPTQHSV